MAHSRWRNLSKLNNLTILLLISLIKYNFICVGGGHHEPAHGHGLEHGGGGISGGAANAGAGTSSFNQGGIGKKP